jgi:hypothetical protein
MKSEFDRTYDEINEGILGDILKAITQAIVGALRSVFGPAGEKLSENISAEVQKTSRVETYNRIVRNFNKNMVAPGLNVKYDSGKRQYFDVYVNLVELNEKSGMEYFKPGDGNKKLADRTPEEVPFKILGYGVKLPGDDKAGTFEFMVKDKPVQGMGEKDVEEVIQSIFDNSVAKNRGLGVSLEVNSLNLKVDSISTADIDFEPGKYDSKKNASKLVEADREQVQTLIKKYVMKGGQPFVAMPSTDVIRFKGMSPSPGYMFVKYIVKKEMKDLDGTILAEKDRIFEATADYTEKIYKLVDLRFVDWVKLMNKKMKEDEVSYRIKSIRLVEEPEGTKRVKVVTGWTYVSMEWEKT